MDIKLHANATTTPKMRAYIQSSSPSVAELSRELGISETCVRRWRSRAQTSDRSHTRHDLGQSTSPEEEALVCALRRDVRLSIDDTVEVMHRCRRGCASLRWDSFRGLAVFGFLMFGGSNLVA